MVLEAQKRLSGRGVKLGHMMEQGKEKTTGNKMHTFIYFSIAYSLNNDVNSFMRTDGLCPNCLSKMLLLDIVKND